MNKQLDIEDLQNKTVYYEDLNIGDYVRFIDYDMLNSGKEKIIKIGKIESKYSNLVVIKLNNNLSKIVRRTINEILKVSKNIIDLIEIGDYVNGKEVIALKGDKDFSDVADEEDVLYTQYVDEYGLFYGIREDQIKNVITKEQFKANNYEVENDN